MSKRPVSGVTGRWWSCAAVVELGFGIGMGREVELDKLRDSKPSVAAGMEDEEEGDGGEELLLLL